MTTKKKTPDTRRVDGHDNGSFDQTQVPWGENLERFFEENDVGMDAVIHWKDGVAEEIYQYDLMGWFDMDGFRPRMRHTTAAFNTIETRSYGKYDPFPSLSRSMYQGRGTFRYEEPGQDLSIESDVKFTFTTLANLGVRGRLQF
jgi:hypothetical protein